MIQRKITRRNFLRASGLGTSALLLANAGLPNGLLQKLSSNGVAFAQGRASGLGVELLVGDVVAFSLENDAWEGAFGSVTFQLHQALYNGETAYYIRTDASDETFSAENHLVYVPLLNAAMVAEGSTSRLYTFDLDSAPEQLPVMSSVPPNDDFSPAWHVHRVTFSGSPMLLDSEAAILEAEANGDVTIDAAPLVVNYPVVKWPGGELQEDTEKITYLGTGPLVSPVNTDRMRVTFKLHECFPGSRYIVTDTSAAPMAEGMNLAASPPTQALINVGATDEIWVFGNGIAGSGVMGFQKAIFDNSAGDAIWSPFWNHFTAVWTDENAATIVRSGDELQTLVDAGAIEIFNGTPNTHPDGFVVNCPVPIKTNNTD